MRSYRNLPANAVSLRTITMRYVACHVASSSQLQCSLLVGQTGFATLCQLARFSLGLSTAAYFVGLWYWVRQSVNSVGPSCGSKTRSSMNAYVLERLSENLFAYRCAFTCQVALHERETGHAAKQMGSQNTTAARNHVPALPLGTLGFIEGFLSFPPENLAITARLQPWARP